MEKGQLVVSEVVLTVPAVEGGTVSISEQLDNDIHSIVAYALDSDKPNQPFRRGSLEFFFDGIRLLPTSYPASLLVASVNVEPDKKYKAVYETYDDEKKMLVANPMPAGNRKVELRYTDSANTAAAYDQYDVRLVVKVLKVDKRA